MMNGRVGLEEQPFINTLSTANCNNCQPASIFAPVISNSTEKKPVAKILKHQVNGNASFTAAPYDFNQVGTLILGPCSKLSILSALATPLIKLNMEQNKAVAKAKKYAMEQSIKIVIMKQTFAHQQQQTKTYHRHQALILMCRVYVGSISFDLKEDSIRQVFSPFGCIKSVNMSWEPITQKHKGFAFIEYELPEAAQLALEQMNGVVLGGRNIKVVGRPSNMPQAQSIIDEIQEEAKQYNRIYISSIHLDLTEDDIKSVFEAFGPIRTCKLAQGITQNRHRGYGFIEYESGQAAIEAISSMNLFELGGQYLRVGRAITSPNALCDQSFSRHMPSTATIATTSKIQAINAIATNAMLDLNITSAVPTTTTPPPGIAIPQQIRVPVPIIPGTIGLCPVLQQTISSPILINPTKLAAPVISTVIADAQKRTDLQKKQEELQKKLLEEIEPQTLQQQENMSIKGQTSRHIVMQKLMRKTESRVVILRNMVGVEDVDDSLQEEIQDECNKFGVVERVIIYKEKQSYSVDSDIIIKIFVEFTQMSEAELARDSLNGRFFGGRLVQAELYAQTLFDYSDFSA